VRYEFAKDRVDRPEVCTVDNLLLVPDGTMALDMDAVNRAAQHQQLRHFGAAQVQLVYDATMPAEEREAVLETFLGSTLELIEALLGQYPEGVR